MDLSDYDKQVHHRQSRDQYITPEEAIELIDLVKRDTFCRLYLPSGKIFLNVIDNQWVLAFFGDYTNMPQAEMKPGVIWKPAYGTYKFNYEEIFNLAVYLWNFLAGTLEDGQRLMESKTPNNRKSSKVLMIQHSPERGQLFLRYIDYSKNQSTIYPISQHHALELYLGVMSAFRSISHSHFEDENEKKEIEGISETPIQMLEEFFIKGSPMEILLRPNKIIVRDIRYRDQIEALHAAHATMFCHMLTSYLCRKLDRVVRFGERVGLVLPNASYSIEDHGNLKIGPYQSDFSKGSSPFNVALHMASFSLVDGLPLSLMR